ncbi:MAG: hypothetical protein L0332_21565 [Chloroflexi bacterium]|nr:hypothetical protein [Chloroflexota bacterium]MCI0729285.1 hypothetical protein [Chloroflexota bacterium]
MKTHISTTYTVEELLNQDEVRQLKERWRIYDHEGGNPLMLSGQLLTCLAIEHMLGRQDALTIIRLALQSLAQLYKYQGNHFDGYIIRWDPTTSDEWVTIEQNGRPVPQYCKRFLIGQNNQYLYCTPFNDPRYVPPLTEAQRSHMSDEERQQYDEARTNCKVKYRYWEPSMDELCGLIMGYDVLFRLVEEQDVRDEICRQVNNLGDYLAEHGYILVRPCGGIAAQGGSGMLPALQFPFNRVFKRITGNSYYARVGFRGALVKAGVWDCIKVPYSWATVAAIPFSVAFYIISPLFLKLGFILLGLADAPITPWEIARAYSIYLHKDCFDVFHTDQQEEFALAYALTKLPVKLAFELCMLGVSISGTGFAGGFPPFSGLTGLDDPDPTVRRSYLSWLPTRRSHPELDEPNLTWRDFGAQTPFASAVAVVLDSGPNEETKLVELLQQKYGELHDTWQSDLALYDGYPPDMTQVVTNEYYRHALGYMVALALAWLHRKRRTDAGTPITTPDFPTLPDEFSPSWDPVVPNVVLNDQTLMRSYVPVHAIQGTDDPQRDARGAKLFLAGAPAKPDTPDPILPAGPHQLLHDIWVTVNESDADVDTGIDLELGHVYLFEATGEIRPNGWVTGSNGPNGWDVVEYDKKFPLHGTIDPVHAHPYCLLGKLNNYFFIGGRRGPERFIYEDACRLRLRINDDMPGNGRGAFQCHIRVWAGPAILRQLQVQVEQPSLPIPLDTQVSVIVVAEDTETHRRIDGALIWIDGAIMGQTGIAFPYTFRQRRVRRRTAGGWEYEVVYPGGIVSATDYPDEEIDFGFET